MGPEKRVELENETWRTNRLGPVSLRALVFSQPAFKEIQILWRENRQVSVTLGPEKRVELESETLMTNRLGSV